MTHHEATLEAWQEALAKALNDGALAAVPAILVRMTRDGWVEEAAAARSLLIDPPPSLGALTGHDREAARQLSVLRMAYEQGGLSVLRAVVHDLVRIGAPEALELLYVEAVLALEEHGPGARRAAAQAAFDRAETANEREQEATR